MTLCPYGHNGPKVRDPTWNQPLHCGYCGRPLTETWTLTGWDDHHGRLWTPTTQQQAHPHLPGDGPTLRVQDLNLRPLGYEPSELPTCSNAHQPH
jgi:hypothetical protein